jgi:hypothetical protein
MNIIKDGRYIKAPVKNPLCIYKLKIEQILDLFIYTMTYHFDYECTKLDWKFFIKNNRIHINAPTHKIVWDVYNLNFTIIKCQNQLFIDYLLYAIDRICEGLENFDAFLKFFNAEKYNDYYLFIKNRRQLRLRIINEKIIIDGEINDKWIQHPICQKYFAIFYDILKMK